MKQSDEIATIHKVEFCKAICNDYGKCGNVAKGMDKEDPYKETLIAPCSWSPSVNEKTGDEEE